MTLLLICEHSTDLLFCGKKQFVVVVLTDKYKLHGGNKMSQHVTASSDCEDDTVGKCPAELGSVTDTQVQWLTRLLPADIALSTGPVCRRGSCLRV